MYIVKVGCGFSKVNNLLESKVFNFSGYFEHWNC
ncbi:hypothetical protein GYH30_043422 [Glycine max]|nr:hypothetical protein GYH30_043422 [Glycine max]